MRPQEEVVDARNQDKMFRRWTVGAFWQPLLMALGHASTAVGAADAGLEAAGGEAYFAS